MMAPVNEIVGLLHNYSPESLSKLKQNYPQFEELLTPGIRMGSKDKQQKELQKFLASVSLQGMKEAVSLCDRVIPTVKKRLILANKIKLLSQVAAVIGGASIFTLLSQSETYATTAKYISACIVLVGTLMPVIAQYTEGGFFQGGEVLPKAYEELVNCRLEASQLLPQIEFCINANLLDSISDLTSKSNVLSKKVKETIFKHVPSELPA